MKFLKQLFIVIAILSTSGTTWAGEENRLMVFAAASMRDVMHEVGEKFDAKNGSKTLFNFAGTNTLARQLMAGAKADVFIAANKQWMNSVDKSGRLISDTKNYLMTNSLVVIANYLSTWQLDQIESLPRIPFRYLAVGDPRGVPAGKYAQRYLIEKQSDGKSVWSQLRDRLAPSPDVRAALNMVASDPSVVGIVYKTDAITSDKVRILWQSPTDLVPVKYTSARIKGSESNPLAAKFDAYINSADAQEIYKKHGFVLYPTKPNYKSGK